MIRAGFIALLMVAAVGLLFVSAISGRDATPAPVDLTTTALVAEATQAVTTQSFGAQSAPFSGGTATPYTDGLCLSVAFRALDDVAVAVETALNAEGLTVLDVDAVAIEDTEDCITFYLYQTAITINLDTDAINDESAIGGLMRSTLTALQAIQLDILPDVNLTVSAVYGNQRRSLELPYTDDLLMLLRDVADDSALLDALTAYRAD